ncbi:MAG: 4-diphosphocytidyl-2-C-methyl-D-erythritol kinase [Chroococcopsis gigantea SAG 12.99]|jgi:4-diphosphocytidyl-2-C-methyl-D-erythritol kinase|nr:4-(cytidine 5'-diphospho)-2-C-methyl-D-erythritol kinase [Chlorogloea purpurea SAG 13.99]MDV2999703.1 4-diphosphocytidyl-2-C-methyl-D-erythritol kinase [Chroococcopsis gigantea SAG 12.99]
MQTYTLSAPAKINLDLEIIGDRPDGYHELVMILQSVALSDRLTLRPNGLEGFRLSCAHREVPTDDTNIAYRAAELMAAQFPQHFANFGGVDIDIEKNIPVAAGLAGGSSNGAAVLVGLDLIWNLGLTKSQLRDLGARLGSDVPFCIEGGTVIATGRGERLAPITPMESVPVILAKYDNLAVSTAWAYQTYRQRFGDTYKNFAETGKPKSAHSVPLVNAIFEKDLARIAGLLHNDLEKVVLPEYPRVANLLSGLKRAGGTASMMSGSGPTVFTLCESEEQARTIIEEVRNQIQDPHLQFWLTHLSNQGITIVN